MAPRLLITRRLPDAVLEAARAAFDVVVRDVERPLNGAEAAAALGEFDAIVPTLGDALDAEAFSRADPLRCTMLANFGVGYNHIDVAAARAAGVEVSNTPGAVTDATADIGLMLLLMAARRASAGEAMVRGGNWKGWAPTQLLGLHLGGRTLGVVGMGRIGRAIARRCHLALGMEVVFFNRSKVGDAGVAARQLDSLQALARCADAVVVALPGGAATRHMIGADFFAAMQSHAVFVNIARGDIIDEAALIGALESGAIAGAGLDVYAQEPRVPAALRALQNVTLLPHLGTNALEVRTQMGMMALENLRAWAQGLAPPNRVPEPAA